MDKYVTFCVRSYTSIILIKIIRLSDKMSINKTMQLFKPIYYNENVNKYRFINYILFNTS